ncbi:MAG: hypothetical protein ABIS67_14435 [Candidatus Eisenbacteria bacterium]
MMDFRELSRLPSDPGYWKGLEKRIVSGLGPFLLDAAEARADWWAPLATRAWSLGGLAVAAVLAALLVLPPRAPERQVFPAGLLRFPEDDPALVALLSDSEPPDLMLIPAPNEEGR